MVLLGFVKYFWRDVIKNQLKDNQEKKDELAVRLSSLDVSGLGITRLPGKTLVQYAGSLVGRDFRAIAQVAPFAVEGLVSPACLEAWKALSSIVPKIWQPEITDIHEYTVSASFILSHVPHLMKHPTGRASSGHRAVPVENSPLEQSLVQ